MTWFSGRARFWRDAFTIHKWTRNLHIKIWKLPAKRNRETSDTFLKYFTIGFIKWFTQWNEMFFANTCLPWSFTSCFVWDVLRPSHFLRTLYASLPWFCVQLDFYAYSMQKFALTWWLLIVSLWASWRPNEVGARKCGYIQPHDWLNSCLFCLLVCLFDRIWKHKCRKEGRPFIWLGKSLQTVLIWATFKRYNNVKVKCMMYVKWHYIQGLFIMWSLILRCTGSHV